MREESAVTTLTFAIRRENAVTLQLLVADFVEKNPIF